MANRKLPVSVMTGIINEVQILENEINLHGDFLSVTIGKDEILTSANILSWPGRMAEVTKDGSFITRIKIGDDEVLDAAKRTGAIPRSLNAFEKHLG